jgi:O-antigen ligase
LLTNLGLIGFALYYALPLALLARTLRSWARRSPPHQSAFAMLVLILMLDLFLVSFGQRGSGVFLAYAAAMATLPGRRLLPMAFPVRRVRMVRAWGAGA